MPMLYVGIAIGDGREQRTEHVREPLRHYDSSTSAPVRMQPVFYPSRLLTCFTTMCLEVRGNDVHYSQALLYIHTPGA
jgi:hypothetical protein